MFAELILHNKGLISKSLLPNKDKNGVIFTFNNKTDLEHGRGQIIRSFKTLAQAQGTHWTPNIFDGGRNYHGQVSGYCEDHLVAINTFVVDLDFTYQQKPDEIQILSEATQATKFTPTLIVATDRGYQLYYVLDHPSYVSNANNYRSLKTARKISANLRAALHAVEPATDTGCNHFGVFRLPTKQNVVFDLANLTANEGTISFNELKEWSLNYSQEQYAAQKTMQLHSYHVTRPQVEETWFDQLRHTTHISSGSGYARNNAIMTLSLACKQSGWDQSRILAEMRSFNSQLDEPLPLKEVETTVESSCQHGYQGASRQYINGLLENWVGRSYQGSSSQKWYKFKKNREERKYSHAQEWQEDLIAYLHEKINLHQGYLQTSWKQIQQDLQIPKTSLKRLSKKMKNQQKLILETKAGRLGFVKITSPEILQLTIAVQGKTCYQNLLLHFKQAARFVWRVISQSEEPHYYQEELLPETSVESALLYNLLERQESPTNKASPG